MYPPSDVPLAMLLEQSRGSHPLPGQAAGSVVLGTWNLNLSVFTYKGTYNENILRRCHIKSIMMIHIKFKVKSCTVIVINNFKHMLKVEKKQTL